MPCANSSNNLRNKIRLRGATPSRHRRFQKCAIVGFLALKLGMPIVEVVEKVMQQRGTVLTNRHGVFVCRGA